MKRILRKAFKAVVFVTVSVLFTFVAVPTMDLLMTSWGSRAIIEAFVCFMFVCWFSDTICPLGRRKRARPDR
ncbi:hypothetical protein [Anaerotignum sp.]